MTLKYTALGFVVLGVLLPLTACSAEPVKATVHCEFAASRAVSCQMSDQVDDQGVHTMTFVADAGKQVRFVGKPQSGWWSGKLNGKPAMGYELNRGHVVFSTMDLKTRFEWWSDGYQHGSY